MKNAKARFMRVLDLIKRDLFYGGLRQSEFRRVKQSVDEKNRKSLVTWSSVLGAFWLFSLYLYRAAEYDACRIVFVSAFVINVVTLFFALVPVRHFPQLLHPVMYLLDLSTLGVGIGLSLAQPDLRIATIIAAAVMVPALFIDRTISTVIMEVAAIIAYAVLGKGVIVPEIYSWGLQTLLIYSAAGVMIGHAINKARFERYIFADSADKLADSQRNFNVKLQQEVEAKTERIVALHDHFLMGMATMVESRDNSTGGHIMRTRKVVCILLDAMREDDFPGLPEEFCNRIINAAPMHDIGKITIDDSILRKPGRFTPEEYDAMKTHAAEGARIIRQILLDADDEEFCRIAESIAHYHHERVDGKGYPEGLKGNEIPLEARIMAIADVYDALVSERSYKKRFSFEEADRIILEGMGTQFDDSLKRSYELARPRIEEYYKTEYYGGGQVSLPN